MSGSARGLSALATAFLTLACGNPPAARVVSVTDIGVFPHPAGVTARDVGFSAWLDERSIWIFGDTFDPRPADDGLGWRSSSWSWTRHGEVDHALGPDGKPVQLLPHTPQEYHFNLAQAGRRLTPWPGAVVAGAEGRTAVVFYQNMNTGPGGPFDFRSVSGSVATWSQFDEPAERIEPPIFANDQPDWGAAAVRVGEHVFVYACEVKRLSAPCLAARVPFAGAADLRAYRYWSGQQWSPNVYDAAPVLDGAPIFSVHFNASISQFVAFYMAPVSDTMMLRTAPAPEGPWSDPVSFDQGLPAARDAWDYALIAHPELSRDGGRIEVLSYTRPTGFLESEIRLVEVQLE